MTSALGSPGDTALSSLSSAFCTLMWRARTPFIMECGFDAAGAMFKHLHAWAERGQPTARKTPRTHDHAFPCSRGSAHRIRTPPKCALNNINGLRAESVGFQTLSLRHLSQDKLNKISNLNRISVCVTVFYPHSTHHFFRLTGSLFHVTNGLIHHLFKLHDLPNDLL